MYIDFHSHVDFFKNTELETVFNEMRDYKIYTLSCSMDIESYHETKKISHNIPFVIPLFGVHPEKAHENRHRLDEFDTFVRETPMIGEIGLDFHWVENEETYESQREVFQYFLKAAKKYDKYINVHTKGAEEEILSWIKKYDVQNQTIIHWYSGSSDTLNKLIEMGCYFTASVDLCVTKEAQERIQSIPIKQLLAETDGPTALEWLNGQYGMPKEITSIYEKICEIKGVSVEEYQNQCYEIMKRMINGKGV